MATTQTPTVRIVGLVDELGYIRCGRCVDVCDANDGFIYDDSYPHNQDKCDACGRRLVETVPATSLRAGDHIRWNGSVWTLRVDPLTFLGYVVCDGDAGYGRTARIEFRADTTVQVCA